MILSDQLLSIPQNHMLYQAQMIEKLKYGIMKRISH